MRIQVPMRSRFHGGAHCSKKQPESSAASVRLADASSGLRRNVELQDGWPSGLQVGVDKLEKLQEELALLMRTKGVTTTEDEDKRRHLPLKRSLNGGRIVKQVSFRKLVTSAFSGFFARPSFREAMPKPSLTEILWALLHKKGHPENSAMSEAAIMHNRTVQMPGKGNEAGEDQGRKWIRTDSEYIVLEI